LVAQVIRFRLLKVPTIRERPWRCGANADREPDGGAQVGLDVGRLVRNERGHEHGGCWCWR